MRSSRRWIAAALGIVVFVVIAAATWASADPDGLERVAQDVGFIDAAQDPGYQILPDYTLPGLDGTLSTIVAGLIGVLVVVGLVLLLGRLAARRPGSGEKP